MNLSVISLILQNQTKTLQTHTSTMSCYSLKHLILTDNPHLVQIEKGMNNIASNNKKLREAQDKYKHTYLHKTQRLKPI